MFRLLNTVRRLVVTLTGEKVFETKITGMSIEHECLNRIIRADLTRKVRV